MQKKTSKKKNELISGRRLMKLKFKNHYGIIKGGVLDKSTGMIICGESEVGKSTLCLEMSLKLLKGSSFIGLSVAKIDGVLILQTENILPVIQERLKKLCNGMKLSEAPIGLYFSKFGISYNLNKKKDVKKIISSITRKDIQVLIIDPLIDYHDSDENENRAMRNVLKNLDKIKFATGASIVFVHHYSKMSDRKGKDRLRGASTIFDWADTVMELSNQKNRNEKKIKFIKMRNAPRVNDICLKMDNNFIHNVIEEKTKCTTTHVKSVLKKKYGGKCDKKGDLVSALCKKADCSERPAQEAIKRALKSGLIKEKKKGKKISIYLLS